VIIREHLPHISSDESMPRQASHHQQQLSSSGAGGDRRSYLKTLGELAI
jgi:hypothetical protein